MKLWWCSRTVIHARLLRCVAHSALCVGLLLSTACVNTLAQRKARLTLLIGRPVSDLIQQLGVPTRSYETEGVKYLAYDESQIQILPGVPGPGLWFNGWWGGGIPPDVIQWQCETTFAVATGIVRSFTLRGNACS